ncbi:MAG: hypothetical protein H6838_12440 [Planctomycetes bacterium]|nr:hypothetical protein [Planctomycetota bacterium]
MIKTRHPKEGGFTFAELAFALLILVIGAVVLINHLTINYLTTNTERDRVFAYTKAQAILSEIQGYVDRGQVDAAVDLDVLDDGIVNRPTLSIQTTGSVLIAPDHVLSGNYQRSGQWIWSRRISVQPFAGLDNRNVRYVTVRIFRKDRDGVDQPMADLSAVINSAGSAFPTTEVFDVYLLAIENIPGWWVYMDSIKPFVESMITDLETRNPGLQFRTHWITKSSFGRNQGYRPYVNDTLDSLQPVPQVYHYPGRMPTGNSSSFYYVPDNIGARINVDGTERNGYDATTNPHPYALADFFNHGMRYYDELELWQTRVAEVEAREQAIAAAIAANTTPPAELDDMSKEPTWRLLLEDMYSSPDKYRNALMINLHGELLPMPALRNYSDAARDPVTYPRIRVVTHPAELRTYRNPGAPGSSDPLQLRIYAYNDNTPTYTGSQFAPITYIDVMGVDLVDHASPYGELNSTLCDLQSLRGGVPVGTIPDSSYFAFATAKNYYDALVEPNEMRYWATWNDSGIPGDPRFTRIYFWNTPVVAPPVGGCGLENTERAQLYFMPYIPCPVEAARNFSTNLASTGVGPKNTARWTLTIQPAALTSSVFVDDDGNHYNPTDDVVLKVKTRIYSGANPYTAGTMWPPSARNQPENLSVTYAWWADSAEDVPITERSQFNGDPRHVPYKDLFAGDADYPDGYNWYHDSLNNSSENSAADYPSITASKLANRWNSSMSCDVPRYFELLRKALVKSNIVYTTLTGFSYYYLGIGNDIGYDSANGYPNSIPSDLTPHGVPSTGGYLNTITSARRFVRDTNAAYWWGKPWLGELFPDSSVSTWEGLDAGGAMVGNLTAGTSSGQFYQGTVNSVYSGNTNRTAYGTAINNYHQRTSSPGCTAFFNIGTSSSSFHHTSTSGTGPLTAIGLELANNYNMTMPTDAPISRPFGLTWSGTTGEHWNFAPYSTQRYSASLYRTYYTHSGGIGSGLVKLVDNTGTDAAYIVVNGIDKTVDAGTTFIAKFACLSLVHSFFEAGDTSNTLRIQQLPRLEIESPTDITELLDPSTIQIQYDVSWTRWDGEPYTATGSFSEDELELEYVIMYSPDNGTTWLHVQDDSVATPSERPTDPTYLIGDTGAGSETYDWDVPQAQFPEGSYLLRIDCFRQGAQVHYSYHKTKIYIQR